MSFTNYILYMNIACTFMWGMVVKNPKRLKAVRIWKEQSGCNMAACGAHILIILLRRLFH